MESVIQDMYDLKFYQVQGGKNGKETFLGSGSCGAVRKIGRAHV
jgi:hypothetical protein